MKSRTDRDSQDAKEVAVQDEDVVWLRLSAVSKRVGVSRETARQLIKSGKLKASRHNERGWYQVREEECDRYLACLESQAA